jgi:hypothetical protein
MDRTESLEVELQRFPLTRDYFGELFRQRIAMPVALDTDLVHDILTPGNFSSLEALLRQLHGVGGFVSLFRRGVGDSDPDGPILAIFAELAGLNYLLEQGYVDIDVQPLAGGKICEFAAQLRGERCLIEVKSLQKEEAQNRLGTILGGVYVFSPGSPAGALASDAPVGDRNTAIVYKLIGRKVRDAAAQIQENANREGLHDWRGVVIVTTTRKRADLDFWDNVCFRALKQACAEMACKRAGGKLRTGVFISSRGAQTYNLRV